MYMYITLHFLSLPVETLYLPRVSQLLSLTPAPVNLMSWAREHSRNKIGPVNNIYHFFSLSWFPNFLKYLKLVVLGYAFHILEGLWDQKEKINVNLNTVKCLYTVCPGSLISLFCFASLCFHVCLSMFAKVSLHNVQFSS